MKFRNSSVAGCDKTENSIEQFILWLWFEGTTRFFLHRTHLNLAYDSEVILFKFEINLPFQPKTFVYSSISNCLIDVQNTKRTVMKIN